MRAFGVGRGVFRLIAAAAAVAAAGAYAQTPPPDCRACGKVASIRTVTSTERWETLGSAVGGIAAGGGPGGSMQPSAVSSFRIGPGGKNEGVVLLGSAGGANYRKSSTSYEQRRWEVTVKMDDGQSRTVMLAYEPFVREGDRVRVAGNNLEPLD